MWYTPHPSSRDLGYAYVLFAGGGAVNQTASSSKGGVKKKGEHWRSFKITVFHLVLQSMEFQRLIKETEENVGYRGRDVHTNLRFF